MSSLPPIELKNAHACFGGAQRYYQHASRETGLPMKFSVYLPRKAVAGAKVPALLYLAGLTCTEETFPIKAGVQQLAAEVGPARSGESSGLGLSMVRWIAQAHGGTIQAESALGEGSTFTARLPLGGPEGK